ncbi:MAG: GNAT family N-acetyltransferase [Armatimonadota bacterium]
MLCEICGSAAWYVDGRSGRPVCPQHARIEIVSRLSFGSSGQFAAREATEADYAKIEELANYFRSGVQVSRLGKEYDITKLPAYVATTNDHICGVLSYAVEPESMVIILLEMLPGYQGLGAGRLLVETAKEKAREAGETSILACTTNDDLPSLYFYQRHGFRIVEIEKDFFPEVEVGFGGIPRRDEIRLRSDV